MPEVRWTFPPMTSRPAHAAQPSPAAASPPVQIGTHGFVLRTLLPADVTPRFVQWINAPAMRAGLNLAQLNFDEVRLRQFIASFDGRHNHIIGIFDQELLVGFYTVDVNLAHKVGALTAGIGEEGYARRKVYWNTIDALLDHFFVYRELDKIVARVLAGNSAMLFNFVDNSRFFFEARLREECLGQDGRRQDVLVFAAFREGERPQGVSYLP
ncbi:GNAT family protein [Stenotrophomonas sp. SY1]|uniref:GNAT family N-acetyltransferase n=1 Tax=Stenotrophomonas sp. SY1 TaxID=477235 RepID=UPI001E385FD5|nr:GNAT family protein [Stenotrophomonas sp. SY1]MCD9087687.1 GNAT family N-acetyltransferase [Stenotrophomonas sp. SY1]